ncbi:uncharacterized protein LOC111431556 [Cucurbita moschata]|uniref:Uncharacterized protein LOC111431556 n=1 Tax=Cucurbita moschata TaxID=3662 RepID=A0A6J1E8C5_CUCMO|nr:uncharacterized protein LOC111431556 [Cucurbita moschata]
MGKTGTGTGSIIRTSIFCFLQKYQYFTSSSALFAFPFSVPLLLSQTFAFTSSIYFLPNIHHRLRLLFYAAAFPPSLEFFSIFTLNLSQAIFSSIFTLPFTLTFLLIAKASVIQALKETKPTAHPSFSSVRTLYSPLLLTHICSSLLTLSANATIFSILCLAFSFLDGFGLSSSTSFVFLSAAGAVLYSIVLANTWVISNLALVLSGMERLGGYLPILKACVLIRGKTSTALLLALPANLAMAAIEALFQYRVVRAYNGVGRLNLSMLSEGIVIAYLYSIFVVLDTTFSCLFFKSCKTVYWVDLEGRQALQIHSGEVDNVGYMDSKVLQEQNLHSTTCGSSIHQDNLQEKSI